MIAVIVSYAFVGIILGVATWCEKARVLSDEQARKLIHVGVAHWFILAMWLFESVMLATLVPASFIVINYMSYKMHLLSAMERDKKGTENLGTVYYAISLTIITYLSLRYHVQTIGMFAILSMGYGDGLGAIVGERYGKRKLYKNKSRIGTMTMFVLTFLIGAILFQEGLLIVTFIALSAAGVELFTPRGFDNLSVPLFIFFTAVLLL